MALWQIFGQMNGTSAAQDPLNVPGLNVSQPWTGQDTQATPGGQLDAQGMPMAAQTVGQAYGQQPWYQLAQRLGFDQGGSWTNQYLSSVGNPSDQANMGGSGINAARDQAAIEFLQSQGLTPKTAVQGSNIFTGLFDQSGNLVDYIKRDTGEENRADALGVAKIIAMAAGGNFLPVEGAGGVADLGELGINTATGVGVNGAAAGSNLAAGATAADVYGTSAPEYGLTPVGATTASNTAADLPAWYTGASTAAPAASTLPAWYTGAAPLVTGGTTLGIPNALIGLTAAQTLGGVYASNKAASAQADAAQKASDAQLSMYNQTRSDNAPLLATRDSALGQINALLANPSRITSEPGYDFGFTQGQRALEHSAAANGMSYSGAQQKALTRFGQDYAGSKLDQSYNRLASLAGLGQVGANNNSAANANYANNLSGNLIGVGNANAGASMYQGNVWQNALNNLAYGYMKNNGMGGWMNTPTTPGKS